MAVTGLRRRLARLPIPVFRAGFGWLLAGRFLLLQHRGRRTGQPRFVVLQVVRREPARILVVSGYGPSSQWFRNVQVTPEVRVWTGRRRAVPATATVVSAAAARTVLAFYRRSQPISATMLGMVIGVPELAPDRALPPDIADRLPMVALAMPPREPDARAARSEQPFDRSGG